MAKRYEPIPKAWLRFFVVLFALPVMWMLISLLFSIAG